MVGTLKLVGEGVWPPDRVGQALAARARAAAGPTAPPDGLTFMAVDYERAVFGPPERSSQPQG
jgi:tRNA pseudouridine38-40 synthase